MKHVLCILEVLTEEFMNGSDTDEIIKELFRSLLQRYQENLQEKMKGLDFAFDGVNIYIMI